MEVEENSNSSLNNIDALSYFKKDPQIDNHVQCHVFDNNYCNNVMKNVDNNSYNGIRNSLIGNFDNGMFDTFKTNITNSSSNSSLLGDIEQQKEVKYNDKYIFNNSFDIFGNGAVELTTTTPMDFENIISYDIYQQHDPFFSINSFQNISDRDNFINNHVNGVTSNAIFCEDDNMNMFEAGNDLKW